MREWVVLEKVLLVRGRVQHPYTGSTDHDLLHLLRLRLGLSLSLSVLLCLLLLLGLELGLGLGLCTIPFAFPSLAFCSFLAFNPLGLCLILSGTLPRIGGGLLIHPARDTKGDIEARL
jgi:hypothetical protein